MKNKLKSTLSVYLTHFYPSNSSQYSGLRFEIFPIIFILGYLIQTGYYRHNMSFMKRVINNEEVYQFLPKGAKDFMSWRYDRTEDRRGLNPNGFHACDTLIKMLGGPCINPRSLDLVSKELHLFFEKEIGRIKLDPSRMWSKSNYMSLGRISFVCTVGAIGILEMRNSRQALQNDLWDYIKEVYEKISKTDSLPYELITHYIFNGVHEYWWKEETASNTEIFFFLSFTKGYISILAEETPITKSSLASMILRGYKSRLSPKENIKMEESSKKHSPQINQLLLDLQNYDMA